MLLIWVSTKAAATSVYIATPPPEAIGAIPRKAPADDIVHAAARHCIQAVLDKLERVP